MNEETVSLEKVATEWLAIQNELKGNLVVYPDSQKGDEMRADAVELVGGLDISFRKGSEFGCACLVVIRVSSGEVVYQDLEKVVIDQPYIPSFLAFREVSHLARLYRRYKDQTSPESLAQVILLDGNGLLHSNKFGLACHLGVLLDVATIGCAKSLFCVDGISKEKTSELMSKELNQKGPGEVAVVRLVGKSNCTLGAAMCKAGNSKPIYVSVGHKVSLAFCIALVKRVCVFRVPQPIRLADILSNEYVRRNICN